MLRSESSNKFGKTMAVKIFSTLSNEKEEFLPLSLGTKFACMSAALPSTTRRISDTADF
jgi:hypothetical protein